MKFGYADRSFFLVEDWNKKKIRVKYEQPSIEKTLIKEQLKAPPTLSTARIVRTLIIITVTINNGIVEI